MPAHRNLLLIVAQGLRSDVLSDAKVWPLTTHRLDAVAQRGVRTVALAASPDAGPAMASLLTGLHVRQHGVDEPTAHLTLREALPGWLREAGHYIAGVGCVGAVAGMLDDAVVVEDVAVAEPAACAYMTAAASKGLSKAIRDQRRQRERYGPFEPDRLIIEPDDDIDGFIAQRAAVMIERMPDERPWTLLVVFSGPGNELPPPTMYDQLVEDSASLRSFIPADFMALDALAEPDYPRTMLQRLEPASIARIRADYLGRAALVDYGVGCLTRAISHRMDRHRIWTLVGSDRGMLLGEHGLVGHRSFLSAAVETPLIVAPPLTMRRPDEPLIDGLFSTTDFAATACAIAGCDAPGALVGRSLLPAFTGEPMTGQPLGGILSESAGRTMLETERYRIVFDRRHGDALGLFDLLEDPDEKCNLVGRPRGHEVIEQLRGRLGLALLPLRAR